MGKKKVPDWLNSSMWSTAAPSPSPDDRCSSKPSTSPHSLVEPRATVPPPPKEEVRQRHPIPEVKRDKDSRSSVSSTNNSSLKKVGVGGGDGENYDCVSEESDGRGASGAGPSAEDTSWQAQLLTELSRKVINMRELRRIASQGIPDGAGIRSTVWKLLLGYLPPDRSLWSSELAKKRSQYKHFKEELLMNPSEITRRLEKSSNYDNKNPQCGNSGLLSRAKITHGDHPLSLGKTSVWNQFFQDSEIMEQIDRDVKRTHPDMHFYSGDLPLAKSNQEALKNILIVFAKLNPGIRYVQGMNEILAPIFYVFRSDPDEEMAASAEADTFFCFVELLSGFRDHFCQQLDNSVVGIRSTITKLSQLLKEHDEELWRHLEVTTKVNPQFYAFRWITLLLTQEFNFADSLHIWDMLLSDPEGPQETLLRICCAMLILIRRRLLAGDFTAILKLLQNYPPTNISHMLYVANKLRAQQSC